MSVFMDNLLSGTIGALIATLLAVWYQQKSEQAKSRKDVMMALVEWMDDIYVRLQEMHIYKDHLYKKQELSLSHEEYKTMSKDVRVLLLSERIIALVACVYGEGKVLQRVGEIRELLLKVARIFWTSEQAGWADSSSTIVEIFEQKIDPMRVDITRDIFKSIK
jgi:hypothetical protein